MAQSDAGWKAAIADVEFDTKRNPKFNYYEEKVPPYTLPDALATTDGRMVDRPRLWTAVRRQEILELFRENVFGRVPPTAYKMDVRIVHEEKQAMNGAATLRQVKITIAAEDKLLPIHLTMFIPNMVPRPLPLYLLINNRGSQVPNLTDPTRKVKSEWWPVEEVVARGYGIAVFNHSDLDPDDFDDFKNGIHGLLDREERRSDSWGTLAAWAWGASRCMDYLETDRDVDAAKVALVGHSRGGKTALWAGAEDERFAMVISNMSGPGGAALARRRFGITLARMNSRNPHWFCTNYRKWSDREDELPVDAHMLIALIAPRAVYITNASKDLGCDPRGSYLALFHAVPVYRLFRPEMTSLRPEMPRLNIPVVSGPVAYHIRDGAHDMVLKDWSWFMDFGDVWLKPEPKTR